jgi:carbamoyltransferase
MGKTSKPVYVLGTGLSHDGSACLLKDGRICVAIEKERITRRKHDGGNDADAIRYCLEAEGITIDDLALVVQNANFGMLQSGNEWWDGPRILHDGTPVVTISHHLAHAYSAVGTSPFEDMAVLIIDGCGNALDECLDVQNATVPGDLPQGELRQIYFEKDSYYIFHDGRLVPVYKDFSPWGMGNRECPMYPNTTMHSIGGLYLAASMYVFNGFDDAGKLMGLAPYGRPGIYDFEIFEFRDDRVFVRYDWMRNFKNPARTREQLKANFQYYADVAYWVQREVERAILYVVSSRYRMAGSARLAYAGGVALNAVANKRILTESPFGHLYVQPAAGDNGLAVGCAYYGWLEVLGRERVAHDGSPFLGRSYSTSASGQALKRYRKQITVRQSSDGIGETAELLANGKIVAWFQGGAEFGPRALGHRSILADPRHPDVRNFINSRIKFREDFRPFAPSVLLEDVSLYFDCWFESPYMILVTQVKPDWQERIPSVVHQDKSARIHTVTKDYNLIFYTLLQRFREITGISVLLNTSLNRRGMPIVETPEQAVGFYLGCELDVLVMDGRIIQKCFSEPTGQGCTNGFFSDEIPKALHRHIEVTHNMRGIYRLDILGRNTWTLDLRKDEPAVVSGFYPALPDVVVEMEESDLEKLREDPGIEGPRLYRDRKVRVQGNIELAQNLLKIFELARH